MYSINIARDNKANGGNGYEKIQFIKNHEKSMGAGKKIQRNDFLRIEESMEGSQNENGRN